MDDGHRLGFASFAGECAIAELPVRGRFPPWLRGALIRNGPSLFESDGVALRHWFDGQAMLHRFAFADGAVGYRCRLLASDACAALRAGRVALREFGTDPPRPWWRRLAELARPRLTDNAAVNVLRIGDDLVAVTETPRALRIDATTLATLGPLRLGDGCDGDLVTAHPLREPDGSATWWFAKRVGPRCAYLVLRQDGGRGPRRPVARIATRGVGYIHAIAMSARFLVIAEYPLHASPLTIALSGRTIAASFAWRPERGTRFLLIDKRDGRVHADVRGEPFFAFHPINAQDDGDAVVVDYAAHDDAAIVAELALDRLRDPSARRSVARWRRLRIGRGGVERLAMPDLPFEFPRCAPELVGRACAATYGTGSAADGSSGWSDRLLKVDGSGRVVAEWRAAGCHPGEPVQVREPGDRSADGGVLLSVVLDTAARRSFLLALDADGLTEIARADLPHAVPFGFHGDFFAA